METFFFFSSLSQKSLLLQISCFCFRARICETGIESHSLHWKSLTDLNGEVESDQVAGEEDATDGDQHVGEIHLSVTLTQVDLGSSLANAPMMYQCLFMSVQN